MDNCLATLIPPEIVILMTRYGEAIRERRELVGFKTATACAEASIKLEHEDPKSFKSFSRSTLSRLELDKTGELIEAAHSRSLRTLSYLLGWTSTEFEQHVGIPIGTVPKLEEAREERLFTYLEHHGEKANLSIKIPIYGTVAAGIKGFEINETPEDYYRFAPEELPKGIQDPNKLYLVKVNGSSMYEENMTRPIPEGSWLLVEAGVMPAEDQLVIAYIPERDLAVIKQYKSGEHNASLRSYRVGGPMFWSQDYPNMRIEGVVRRISYEP